MSAKSSAQPGRRTPLSLSGAVTKSQPNRGSNNIANGSGNNANSHQTSNNSKQDNKSQQQKHDQPIVSNLETKDNSNKKQQTQNEKKIQQNENKKSNEKNQNGVGSSNKQQETSENKQQQQQQNKEKPQQPNGNDSNKVVEEEKNNKSEKFVKSEKSVKDITKSKEDKKEEQNIPENKKEEKKIKESKEDKNEGSTKSDAVTETKSPKKSDDKKSNDDDKSKNIDKKSEDNMENMEIDNQNQQTSSNSATPKSSNKATRNSTPVNKTPTKFGEKTPQKSIPTNSAKTTPVIIREVTTVIDDNNDVEMEPLAIESSPAKPSQPGETANIKITPTATSTPGKLFLSKRSSGVSKSDVKLPKQTEISTEAPRMISQISCRRSIRPISDFTPSKFQSNLQYRESYRRINTELDVSNSSMNVTVGSEAPSNLSFSIFGRGRKRERTSPQHSQSAIGELLTDIETSPPKKARLEKHGFFYAVVSSPLTLLRNRFSKTSLQSSTPVKLQQKLNPAEDEFEVQNVSGVSVHEEIATSDNETNITIDDNDATLGEEVKETKLKTDAALPTPIEVNADGKEEQLLEQSDIKVIETSLEKSLGDTTAKKPKCVVM